MTSPTNSAWNKGASLVAKLADQKDERELAGKVAIVTGGAGGIGSAISEHLGSLGATVVVHYNTREKEAQALVEKITSNKGKAWALKGDLKDIATIRRVILDTVNKFGRVDILVNNAAMWKAAPADKVVDADYEAMFSVNTKAPFFLMQEAARRMKDGGRVVNITSMITNMGVPYAGHALYAATKAALHEFSKHLALELGPKKITVNSVAPGMVETSTTQADATFLAGQAKATPLGRNVLPQDVAELVGFLCGSRAQHITGSTIPVNGGRVV